LVDDVVTIRINADGIGLAVAVRVDPDSIRNAVPIDVIEVGLSVAILVDRRAKRVENSVIVEVAIIWL
jgi:hypothetical protein